MSLDVQESLKMNADFWPPRGPNPAVNNYQPLMDPANDYHMQRNNNNQSGGFHNNNNDNGVVDLKDHLMAGQENPNNFNQSTSGFQMNQQQLSVPAVSPSAENSSPESKFNGDKFANEIQVSFKIRGNFFSFGQMNIFGAKIKLRV